MDGRLALLSGAVFAGVLVAGGIISSGSLNPADAYRSLTGSDSPEQRIVQDQRLAADGTSGQASEASFSASGQRRDDHREHERDDDDEGDDD